MTTKKDSIIDILQDFQVKMNGSFNIYSAEVDEIVSETADKILKLLPTPPPTLFPNSNYPIGPGFPLNLDLDVSYDTE